jgi:hypothetical protein
VGDIPGGISENLVFKGPILDVKSLSITYICMQVLISRGNENQWRGLEIRLEQILVQISSFPIHTSSRKKARAEGRGCTYPSILPC